MQKYWSNPAENPFSVIVNRLAALAPAGTPLDFSRILVIVPGRLGIRNLKSALVQRFPQGVFSPEILTPSKVLQYGMENLRCASTGEQLAIWEHVLTRLKDSNIFHELSLRHGGACSELDCRNLAKVFFSLREELVQGGKTIAEAEQILKGIAEAKNRAEDKRWHTLSALELAFTADLKDFKLMDPAEANKHYVSSQAAAMLAEKFDHIVVAFLPDMPKLLEEKLKLVEDRVTLLIHGEESDAEKFDAWGRPATTWSEERLPVKLAQLHSVTNPEQAALLTLALATQDGTRAFDPAQSAIVLGKPEFFPAFESVFQKIHYEGENKPVTLFAPDGVSGIRLRIAGFLQKLNGVLHNKEDFAAFNALVRDSVFAGYLRSGTGLGENQFLGELDDFTLKALPDSTPAAIVFLRSKNQTLADILQKGADIIRRLNDDTADFCTELKKLLKAVFDQPGYPPISGVSFDDEADYWQKAITGLQRSPIQPLLQDAGQKLRYLLQDCENETFYPGRDDDAVLVYNFLEYPALTQPELFIVGMNWGIVPAVRGTTPYLTDSIRKSLNLAHSESLAALETYKMITLLQSKPNTHLVTLKFDETNTPLRPAGMLFNGCDEQELLDRATYCREAETVKECGAAEPPDKHFCLNLQDVRQHSFFQEDPLEFSATDFKTYLSSPRLFILQKILHVDCPDYANSELDSMAFGSVCHKGIEALKNAKCTSEYYNVMESGMNAYLDEKYGRPLPFLVSLQREQLCSRLQAAAKYFAENREYRLLESEYPINGGQFVDFGGARIKGKIDRIELSGDGKKLRLVDVKTYNTAKTPEDDHVKGGDLINLQLPLYHQLLKLDTGFWSKNHLDPNMKIEVGYLLLTADSDVAELKLWEKDFTEWSEKAEAKVKKIVTELQKFAETGEPLPEPKSAKYYELEPLFVPNSQEAFHEEKQ